MPECTKGTSRFLTEEEETKILMELASSVNRILNDPKIPHHEKVERSLMAFSSINSRDFSVLPK